MGFVNAAKFNGIITPENADALFIDQAGQTLKALLESLGEVPDVDYDMNGTPESYTITATFATVPVWLF